MANQSDDPGLSSAQIVGNAFIQQYYLALHKSPDVVHKFYSDNSVLSRPGPDGMMTSVTTMQEINEMILSLDYQNYHAQILTADAQFSYKDGVIVLVTGCLTGNNNERRKFIQSFFLAPQDKVAKSYFVLNDVFRYVDGAAGYDVDESSQTPLTPLVGSTNSADQPMLSETADAEVEIEVEVDNGNYESQVIAPLDQEKEIITEKGVTVESGHAEVNSLAAKPVDASQTVAPSVIETAPSTLPEDVPKKSFASVVNALNKNSAPFHMRAPQPKPVKLVEQPRAPVVPEQPAPTANGAPEKDNDPAVKAHAIFVANLPMSATVEELDKLFKQFGAIKHDGIQVRSNKGTCFGFVEFESASSMHSALEASPIVYSNRKLSIEERRANNDRAKFASGRSGYRNDNFRGNRGNYGGNRGYGRNELEKRGEFSGRARGNGNVRNGEAYQRPFPNVGERAGHQEAKVA